MKVGHQPQECNVSLVWLEQELTLLAHLPRLRDLALQDPTSSPNPVCLLGNYATHLLYHIPALQRLDAYDVSSTQVKEAAEVRARRVDTALSPRQQPETSPASRSIPHSFTS